MSITEIKGPNSDAEFKPAVPNLTAETTQSPAQTEHLDGHTSEATLGITGTEPVIDLRDKPVAEHPAPAPAEPHIEAAQPAEVSTGQHAPESEVAQAVDAASNEPDAEASGSAPQKKGLLGIIKGIFSHDGDNGVDTSYHSSPDSGSSNRVADLNAHREGGAAVVSPADRYKVGTGQLAEEAENRQDKAA